MFGKQLHSLALREFYMIGVDVATTGAIVILSAMQAERGDIPVEADEIQRLLRMDADAFQKTWFHINNLFPVQPDGTRWNSVIKEMRTAQIKRAENARKAKRSR
jgi:ribulose 1,5-bisphosphate carboxylase large subunit-like protein